MTEMNGIYPDFSGNITIKSSRMTEKKKKAWILLRDLTFP